MRFRAVGRSATADAAAREIGPIGEKKRKSTCARVCVCMRDREIDVASRIIAEINSHVFHGDRLIRSPDIVAFTRRLALAGLSARARARSAYLSALYADRRVIAKFHEYFL